MIFDLCSSLETFGIQDHLLHALVFVFILSQRAKNLVSMSSFQLVGISLVHALLARRNPPLNEMGQSSPALQPEISRSPCDFHSAGRMVSTFL